ncbi:3-keto-disaccharide hydrolase [Lentiprolixibacter aurantiacus]|uniref:DUF1080 domain-containing protein n=1 Tax=Lentiprolixibacter aurantiacus TaxID=2993939 RepID=A0AAE3MNJ1_9FLAO|nr:DUF1080 domain-containing protein [Lentiprolixibacter aurantiacus]MCX2720127.1 DUF1080 domain-containing protein [Lentiprolixibacter aurantiacus]
MNYSGILFVILLITFGCRDKKESTTEEQKREPVTQEVEWISLMSPDSWRGYNQEGLPDNWVIEGDIIECLGKAGDVGGDIISREQYGNFELQLEWKISEGGNSGIFYHVVESEKYHSPYETGPEYQILDDLGFPGPLEEWQKAGADYAMHLPNDQKSLKPVGSWNSTKIIFNKGKVEHWLNGKKILEFDKFSDDWKQRRNSGKWDDYPNYGMANSGHLGLQDHGAGVWFRNVRVKRL